ncbi:MAG: hypothetical protein HUK40_06000 [Desulfobacter sp.]|nr:hypothetical protein [Desulfobacter sp.]WDP84968.1 MAG: hypothetical protein HUN05_07230 [Desulfobacter sp.]
MALDPIWHSLLFIGAALAGIAGPIFIRTLFAHRVKDATRVNPKAFMAFQKRLILVAGITPYFALVALACDLPQFYSGAIVLMALYALYYHFPSRKRIEFDQKIFRVKE